MSRVKSGLFQFETKWNTYEFNATSSATYDSLKASNKNFLETGKNILGVAKLCQQAKISTPRPRHCFYRGKKGR